jgi:hypothetical protein
MTGLTAVLWLLQAGSMDFNVECPDGKSSEYNCMVDCNSTAIGKLKCIAPVSGRGKSLVGYTYGPVRKMKPASGCKAFKLNSIEGVEEIAVVDSGYCTLAAKAKNAAAAGYSAIVVVDSKQKSKMAPTDAKAFFSIPVVQMTRDVAKKMLAAGDEHSISISMQRKRASPTTGQLLDATGLMQEGNMYKNDCRHSCWKQEGCPGEYQDSAECYGAMLIDNLKPCYAECKVMTSKCYQDCANGHRVEDHLVMAIDAEVGA